MKEEVETAIKALVKNALNASDSGDALRWSQSATNIANAFATFNLANKQ